MKCFKEFVDLEPEAWLQKSWRRQS